MIEYDWTAGADLIDDYITVCAKHLRFVPCRHGNGDCVISSERNDVAATYLYQQGGNIAKVYIDREMDKSD
jgi:hypothetical protein